MTDAEYIFKTDANLKKNISRSYYHKKGGARTSSCRLSSDNLTKAQWAKKNGEIMTVNLNKPMEYRDFKRLARDTQLMYLKGLRDKYNPRMKDVAEMMGTNGNAFSQYIINNFDDFRFTNHGKTMPEAFKRFLEASDPSEEPVVEESAEAISESISEPVNESKPDDSKPVVKGYLDVSTVHGNVSFVGDPYAVFARAVKLFDEGKRYKISISFKEAEEQEEANA